MSLFLSIRGLLPILFATVMLALSTPQAAAAEVGSGAPNWTEQAHDHHGDCSKEPMHAIGCCSLALVLPAAAPAHPEIDGLSSSHGLAKGIDGPATLFHNDLFRPPRLA